MLSWVDASNTSHVNKDLVKNTIQESFIPKFII